MHRVCRTLVRIPVAGFIFFDERRSLSLLIKLVKNEGLRRPVAWTFGSPPEAYVAFWFGLVTSNFSLLTRHSIFEFATSPAAKFAYLSTLKAARGSLRHCHTACNKAAS